MRMIEWRHGPDAHEFLGADLYFGNANIIMEMRNDMLGHLLDCLPAVQGPPYNGRMCGEKAANACQLWQVRTSITSGWR